MKIGIIGSGIVGRTLGNAFLNEGHDVMLGTRDLTKAEVIQWKENNSKGQIGLFSDTASFGELIVLATSGIITADAVKLSGIENFSNKIVIDTTNPIAKSAPESGVMKFFTTLDHSLMEELQTLLPESHLVKAFNSVGSSFMYKPDFNGVKPTMFICGNNDEAKSKVNDLLITFGWEVEDMGTAISARAIEPLCMLWCIPGMLHGQWSHAFKLLKK